jgi:hypothetical protein
VEGGFVIDSESGISCRSSLLAERARSIQRRQSFESSSIVARLYTSRESVIPNGRHRQLHGESQTTGKQLAIARSHSNGGAHAGTNCSQSASRCLLPMAFAAIYDIHAGTTRQQSCWMIWCLHCSTALMYEVSSRLSESASHFQIASATLRRPDCAWRDLAEARFLNHEDTTPLRGELEALVSSSELDEMRRLRAARVLMITADGLVDDKLARAVLDSMPRKPVRMLLSS